MMFQNMILIHLKMRQLVIIDFLTIIEKNLHQEIIMIKNQ